MPNTTNSSNTKTCKDCIIDYLKYEHAATISELRWGCLCSANNYSVEQVNADINDLTKEGVIISGEYNGYELVNTTA